MMKSSFSKDFVVSPHCLKRCAVVASTAASASAASASAAMKHNPALKFMDRIGQDSSPSLFLSRLPFPVGHAGRVDLVSRINNAGAIFAAGFPCIANQTLIQHGWN
ncbi:hypothetical protein EYF80_019550 [Liparis tanakae]|uniref:Uncharacterized protein n=1 Tax=Liparis tanakae TaxID=230148 RepID=A0A4Z2HWG9_9TELE|nr:hypothetical protein EYF80_019550 [Liparis tanakae]